MQPKIHFEESGSFLLIYPTAVYPYQENSVIGLSWREIERHKYDGRDWEKERQLAEIIAAQHEDLNINTNHEFFQIKLRDALYGNWFIHFYRYCQEEGYEVSIDKLKEINLNPAKAKINYNISSGIDWVDFKVDVQFNQLRVSVKELRRAILNNDLQVKLDDGTYGYLSNDWVALLQPIFMFGKRSKNVVRIKHNQYPILESLNKKVNFSDEVKDRFSVSHFDANKQVPLPKEITATPRSYQQSGYNWLVALGKLNLGACLADDMGLGKTLQMLMYICWYLENEPTPKPVLVVCPKTLLFNWKNEVEKFAPHLSVHTHWGNKRTKDVEEFKAFDIILTSYGTMMSDVEVLKTVDFGVIILDESQAIKTPTSQRTYCAKQLMADHRFIMTGTPVENNTFELWSQMDFINPGLLGSFHQFKSHFKDVIGQVNDKAKAAQLRQLINPYILRRTKAQVATELPEKTEMILACDMENEQREIYETYRTQAYRKVKESTSTAPKENNRFQLLSYLLRLRQLCNSTHLVDGYPEHSIKIKVLMEHILQKNTHHKILVFSQFLGMIDNIGQELEREGIGYSKLTGASNNRQELVDNFENDENTRVFLISIKAGGTGLNLTCADYVYIVDPWWNPAVENQAIDRAYRIGQTKKVMAYRMICSNSIEEKIQELQQRKQQLSDDLIQAENGFEKQLSKADFVSLLE